jgi:SpoVK/Ycf46/Vps4 family AAA+-type ATPase
LEENKTPAIWVCNKVSQIDSAFLRRFDYVMELNTPPKSVRLNIVKSYLEDKSISADFLEKLAEHKELSPALIANLSKVASRINESQENLDDVLLKVVNNSLKAMSFKPLSTKSKDDTHYDFNYLNTNIDMNKLIKGLQRSKKGNLCFYGAPGTGKTALAGYIAKQLDKPLLSKKASDILGMYVGQSEKNIAAMFEEAKQEEAVLVLDEADSLLRDRRGAKQSWEVSQVNELLVQMENFDGLFICSTNLMDDLDQASLRRFAIKVKFDYLKPEQACRMLEKECVGVLSDKDNRDIASMSCLAPGDFSAVKKRLDILGMKGTADVMIQELKEEVLIKSDHHTSNFGFIH